MPDQLEIAEAEALKLEPEDRVRLAERLIASVFGNEALEEEWAQEIERRVAEIEGGRAELVPADHAIRRARAAIK